MPWERSKPCLNSCRTTAAWEEVCWEFKNVDGIPNLRFNVIIWSWIRERRGDMTTVTPGWTVAGSCTERIKCKNMKRVEKAEGHAYDQQKNVQNSSSVFKTHIKI